MLYIWLFKQNLKNSNSGELIILHYIQGLKMTKRNDSRLDRLLWYLQFIKSFRKVQNQTNKNLGGGALYVEVGFYTDIS